MLPARSCKGLFSFSSPPHSDWGPPVTQASSPLEGVPVCQAEGQVGSPQHTVYTRPWVTLETEL